MSSERIVKNQKYRILTDKINRVWDKISFWTHSDDVSFDDGKNLTTKMKEISDRIDKLNGNSSTSGSVSNVVKDAINDIRYL